MDHIAHIGGILEVAASAALEEVSGNLALAQVLELEQRSALPAYLIFAGGGVLAARHWLSCFVDFRLRLVLRCSAAVRCHVS